LYKATLVDAVIPSVNKFVILKNCVADDTTPLYVDPKEDNNNRGVINPLIIAIT
jgi:hypothetical protein